MPAETVIWQGHPTWRAMIGWYTRGALAVMGVLALLWLGSLLGLGPEHGTAGWVLWGLVLFALVVAYDTLRRFTTTYTVTSHRLHIRRGIIARNEQSARIERVQNVNTHQGPLERLLRVGVIDFDTAGTGEAEASFRFDGVANPHQIVAEIQPHLAFLPGNDAL